MHIHFTCPTPNVGYFKAWHTFMVNAYTFYMSYSKHCLFFGRGSIALFYKILVPPVYKEKF